MRCITVLLLVLTVSILGCKTEKLKTPDSGTSNPQKPDPDGVLLEGTVGLGSISAAEVSVHRFVNGELDWQSTIGSGETDDSGRFTIAVEDEHLGSPVVVKVLGIPNLSRLRCTLMTGCGQGTSLGDMYQLNEPLELFLMIPNLQRRTYSNPSVLSHVAFKAFEKSNPTVVNTGLISYQIERSNSMVAGRFGVLRDLLSIPQPDLASLTDNVDLNDVRAAVLNMALLQATQKRTSDTEIANVLSAVANQYVDVGLPDVSADDDLISVTDVLREASLLVASLQREYGINLNSVLTQLDAQTLLLSYAGESAPSQGHPSYAAGLTGIEKGKALADNVRRFASSVNLRKLAGLTNLSQLLNEGPLSILDIFNTEPAPADVLENENVDHAISALSFVAEAAFTSVIDYYADSVVLTSYEGIQFQHYIAQNNHVFAFQTDYDPCEDLAESCVTKLNLNLIIRVVRFTGNAGTKTFAPDALDISVAGSAEVGDIRVVLPQNDFQFRSIKPSISISDYIEDVWAGSDYLVSADAMRVRLPFEVINLSMPEGIGRYAASVSMDVGKFRLHYTDRSISADDSDQSKAVTEGLWRIKLLENLKVGFVEQSQKNLASALYLNQAAALVSDTFTFKTSVIHCEPQAVDCEEHSDMFIEGENDEQFLSIDASAAYKTKLKGGSDSTFAQLTFSRNSPSSTSIENIQVSYPGYGAVLTGSFNSSGGMSALNAANFDGVTLFFNTIAGKRRGEVQSSIGDKIADVIDMGQWVKIQYINGDFESL